MSTSSVTMANGSNSATATPASLPALGLRLRHVGFETRSGETGETTEFLHCLGDQDHVIRTRRWNP